MDEAEVLRPLLEEQSGLLTRGQAFASGLSPSAVRWRLARDWYTVLPGVIAVFSGALTPRQHLIAAQLWAGPTAFVSSLTAAAWHGVESARQSSMIRLSAPPPSSSRSSGLIVVRRTTRPDEQVWLRGPLRIASRGRAVVDAAYDASSERTAAAIVLEAVQRRIVSVQALRHELERGPQQRRARVRKAVEAAERNIWSVAEFDLVDVLAKSSILPEVWANPTLHTATGQRLPRPDAWVDEVGLAIQVHSRAYHLRDVEWNATVSADSALGEAGIVVLGVTPDQLRADPDEIRCRVERAYLSLRTRLRPAVIAPPGVET